MNLGTLANNNDGSTRPEKYKVWKVEDYAEIVTGQVPLPNPEEISHREMLNRLAAGGHGLTSKWGYSQVDGQKVWTMFFLTSFMGYDLDGGGYAISYANYGKEPLCRYFQICKHEKVDAPGANHNRGYHPGWCRHCGMDMSYDSGD